MIDKDFIKIIIYQFIVLLVMLLLIKVTGAGKEYGNKKNNYEIENEKEFMPYMQPGAVCNTKDRYQNL